MGKLRATGMTLQRFYLESTYHTGNAAQSALQLRRYYHVNMNRLKVKIKKRTEFRAMMIKRIKIKQNKDKMSALT